MSCHGTTESLGISRSSRDEQDQPCSCRSGPIWCNTPTAIQIQCWKTDSRNASTPRWRQLVQPIWQESTCGWCQRWWRCCATTPWPPEQLCLAGLVATQALVSANHLSAWEDISLCMDSPFWSSSTLIYNGSWSIFKMPLCSKMEICNYVSLTTIITTDHGESG